MSVDDVILLLPWLLLTSGMLILLMLIGFWRHHRPVAVMTVLLLLAVAATAAWLALGGTQGRVQTVELMTLDGLAQLMAALFALAGAVTAALSWRYLEGRDGEAEEFYILLMCAVLGGMTLAAADHFAMVLLGLEILGISLYTLIAYTEEGHHSLEAGLKYLILSAVASTTLLFGVALLYAQTGSLGLDALGGAGSVAADDPLVLSGAVLVLAGIAFKLSLVPFHQWTPDVYEGAPAPVTAFLATVSKSAVVVFLMRTVLASDVLQGGSVFVVIASLAMLSMLLGNLLALMQKSVKRVLAYSSVAHMGYLLIALLAVGGSGDVALGVEATTVYIVVYTVMTLAAFAVIATLSSPADANDLDSTEALTGLFWRRPLAAGVLAIALLSLAGIPLTAGFMGKFYLVAVGVESGYWPLLWMLVIGSGIGLFYYLRILHSMVRTPEREPAALAETGLEGGWVLGSLAGATLLLGTWPGWLVALVQTSLGY